MDNFEQILEVNRIISTLDKKIEDFNNCSNDEEKELLKNIIGSYFLGLMMNLPINPSVFQCVLFDTLKIEKFGEGLGYGLAEEYYFCAKYMETDNEEEISFKLPMDRFNISTIFENLEQSNDIPILFYDFSVSIRQGQKDIRLRLYKKPMAVIERELEQAKQKIKSLDDEESSEFKDVAKKHLLLTLVVEDMNNSIN